MDLVDIARSVRRRGHGPAAPRGPSLRPQKQRRGGGSPAPGGALQCLWRGPMCRTPPPHDMSRAEAAASRRPRGLDSDRTVALSAHATTPRPPHGPGGRGGTRACRGPLKGRARHDRREGGAPGGTRGEGRTRCSGPRVRQGAGAVPQQPLGLAGLRGLHALAPGLLHQQVQACTVAGHSRGGAFGGGAWHRPTASDRGPRAQMTGIEGGQSGRPLFEILEFFQKKIPETYQKDANALLASDTHTHTHTSCGKTSGDQTRGTTSVKTKAGEGRALVTETISSGH